MTRKTSPLLNLSRLCNLMHDKNIQEFRNEIKKGFLELDHAIERTGIRTKIIA